MSKSSKQSPSVDAGALLEGFSAFSVLLPRCLVGERFFIARDAADAFSQYKELGGIRSTPEQPIIHQLEPGSDAYAKALSDYEAGLAKAAGQPAAE